MNSETQKIVAIVEWLLEGGSAYEPFNEAVAGLEQARNFQHKTLRTPWQIVEHMARCIEDVLDFIENPSYQEPKLPDEYWAEKKDASREEWRKQLKRYRSALDRLQNKLKTKGLFDTMPTDSNKTILREALLVADHNAYHIGQLAMLAQLWEAQRDFIRAG